jgi:PAS domain S-box-containing protein
MEPTMASSSQSEERLPLPGVSREWLRILEINPDAVVVLGPDEHVAYANPAAARLLDDGRGPLEGRLLDVGEAPVLAERVSPFRQVLRSGRPVQDVELPIQRDDARRILSVNAAPLAIEGGAAHGVIASIRDVTERRRAELHERLLAEAGRVIAGSLNSDAMLKALAGLVIPAVADGCVLELFTEGRVRRFAAHADEQGVLQYHSAFLRPPVPELTGIVVRSRTPALLPLLTEETLGEQVRDPVHIEELRAAGAKSLMCVPLVARGEVEGAITFASTRQSYDTADRTLAVQLADRVALALSNVRLYRAAQEASAEAATQHARATEILESITDAFWATDLDWRFTYVNHHAEKVLGSPREELIGRRIWEAFPESVGTRAHAEMTRALQDRTPRVFEIESRVLDRWLEVHVYPSERGLSIYLHDIGERKEAEAAQTLVVQTGIALAETLDLDETLRRGARVAIPFLADLCTIDLVEDGTTLRRAAAAAADATVEETLQRTGRRHPPDWRLPSAAMETLRTGEPVLHAELSDAAGPGAVPDPELLRLVQEHGVRSTLIVPLAVHGQRLGVVTFAFARSGRHYGAGHLGLACDVARRIALAIANARLYEEAQASNEAKSNFISVISHEFRTPLTAIVGYVDLLLDQVAGTLNAKQSEQLGRVKSSAWHLTHLVEEILTFSRMEAGRESVESELIDLAEVARHSVMLIEPVAAAKTLKVGVDLPAEPVIVRSDSGKIGQILINLLGNAVKFTDAGEVRLRLASDARRHVFDVIDTGVGIGADDSDRIFDAFWQVDQGTTRRMGGTGLGLTIARRLARLLGGEIEVNSERGRGSTFRLSLPAAQPAHAEPVLVAGDVRQHA